MHPVRRLSEKCSVKIIPGVFNVSNNRNKSSSKSNYEHRPVIDSFSNILRSPFSDVVVPNFNLPEFVWNKIALWKNRPALTDVISGRTYTYQEAEAASKRLSTALPESTGLKSEDKLGLVMPNSPEFAFTLLGATAAGIVVSPANPLYTAEELSRQLGDAGIKAVVTVPLLLDKVRKALEMVPGGGGRIVVATDGSGEQEATLASQHPNVLSLHKLLSREYTRRTPYLPRADPDQLAILPYSSGTTGVPKGVRISHRNMVANLCQMHHPNILPLNIDIQDVGFGILPFFHIYGLNGVLNASLSLGRHIITMPRFDPALFIASFNRYKPTTLSLVPPIVNFLVLTDNITSEDLKRLRSVISGAAPMTRPVIESFLKKANSKDLDFRQGYGMTETSCMALFSPPNNVIEKIGAAGVPVSLTEIKILDKQGNALPQGQTGELVIRGPQIMQGYHNNDVATKETFTEDGWLKTGDIAYVDEEGLVFIVDRIKELIKVKGLQVAPTELEGVLRKMEGVADVAVVGVPDERSGEVPRAFVVRKANSTITETDVMNYMNTRVAPFKQFAGGVRFVPEIPKNAAGKTERRIIKKWN